MDERNRTQRGKEAGRGEPADDPRAASRTEAESEGTGGRSRETVSQPVRSSPGHEEEETLRQGATEMARKGKEKAKEAAETGRDALGDVREKAGELTRETRERVSGTVEERKSEAADALERVARAFRSAAESLREEEADALGRYGERAAAQIERFSGYVRKSDLESMVAGVEDFARRRPEVFYGGLLLGGVAAGRFLRSSSHGGGGSGRRLSQPSRQGGAGVHQPAGALPSPAAPRGGDGITEGKAQRRTAGGSHERV